MRTTITISDAVLDLVKQRAARDRLAVSEVVEIALVQYLNPRPKRTSETFKLPVVHGRPLKHGVNLDRTNALLVADDETAFGSRGE